MTKTRLAIAAVVAILLGALSPAADAYSNCTTSCYGNTCTTHCW